MLNKSYITTQGYISKEMNDGVFILKLKAFSLRQLDFIDEKNENF